MFLVVGSALLAYWGWNIIIAIVIGIISAIFDGLD